MNSSCSPKHRPQHLIRRPPHRPIARTPTCAGDHGLGVGAGFAEGDEGFDGFFEDGARAGAGVALGGGVEGFDFGGGEELVDLAVELGDDGFGEALADLGELGEGLGVAGDDGAGDCGGVGGHGAEGLAVADAFDGGEELEEGPLGRGLEADEAGDEGAALALALEVGEGGEGDRLAGGRGQALGEEGGAEDLVGERAAGGGDAEGEGFDGFEGAGDAADHLLRSPMRRRIFVTSSAKPGMTALGSLPPSEANSAYSLPEARQARTWALAGSMVQYSFTPNER